MKEERDVLLRELLSSNQKDDSIQVPNWMTKKTKIADLTFKRKVNVSNREVELNKVVGTTHSGYQGRRWIDIYYSLERIVNIKRAITEEDYYNYSLQNPDCEKKCISFIKIDDEYYIDDGNHRVVLAKIKGIRKIVNVQVVHYITDYDYKSYYDKLKELKFEINFGSKLSRICKNEYEWETLIITVGESAITLDSLYKIEQFYLEFMNLKTERLHIFLNKLKRLFFEFSNTWHHFDRVTRFFIRNYEILVEHKRKIQE